MFAAGRFPATFMWRHTKLLLMCLTVLCFTGFLLATYQTLTRQTRRIIHDNLWMEYVTSSDRVKTNEPFAICAAGRTNPIVTVGPVPFHSFDSLIYYQWRNEQHPCYPDSSSYRNPCHKSAVNTTAGDRQPHLCTCCNDSIVRYI